jgi:hypothetical protein
MIRCITFPEVLKVFSIVSLLKKERMGEKLNERERESEREREREERDKGEGGVEREK